METLFSHRTRLAAALFTTCGALSGTAFGALAVVSGSNTRGAVTQSLQIGNGTALLSSFDFNFGFGNDHHIRTIKVMPNEDTSQVTTGYYDKNADDAYSFKVGFHPRNDSRIIEREASGSCRGRCTTTVQVPLDYIYVMRGFEFNFSSADHQLRTIAVEHGNNVLSVQYNDKNADDAYTWKVRYAMVPVNMVVQTGQSSGSGIGASNSSMPSGLDVALRGFMLSYTGSGDHHISRVSVLPTNGKITANFHDKNADDGMQFRAQWARLR